MLSKRQSIRECKRVWRPVLEGKARDKEEALKLYPKAKNYYFQCPFCDYDLGHKRRKKYDADSCFFCPLVEQTGWDCCDKRISFLRYPDVFASVIMALKE